MPDAGFVIHPDADRFGGWRWEAPWRGEHFRRCSFCGCVHPEDLSAEPVWRANWADRKYGWPHKFYVDIPNRDPDRLYVTSAMSRRWGERHEDPLPEGVVRWEDLTPQQLEVARRDGWDLGGEDPPSAVTFGTHPHHWGKFYSVHLADPVLDPRVVADIERRSGVAFVFGAGGRVSWRQLW